MTNAVEQKQESKQVVELQEKIDNLDRLATQAEQIGNYNSADNYYRQMKEAEDELQWLIWWEKNEM